MLSSYAVRLAPAHAVQAFKRDSPPKLPPKPDSPTNRNGSARFTQMEDSTLQRADPATASNTAS